MSNPLGRLLVQIGSACIVAGLLFMFTPLGNLPGDITISRKNVTFYFPLTTSIIISIVLYALHWLVKSK